MQLIRLLQGSATLEIALTLPFRLELVQPYDLLREETSTNKLVKGSALGIPLKMLQMAALSSTLTKREQNSRFKGSFRLKHVPHSVEYALACSQKLTFYSDWLMQFPYRSPLT